ncbi:MAG: hypothetical protein K8I82_12320, partial [Anaerolineae bacterium]|nr:hypothetical protein [Anaerolineae bacterium]
MIRLPLTPNWFPDNAIMRAERSHQEWEITQQRRWRRYLQRMVNWFMLTIGMILFWGEFAGALTKRDASPIGEKLGILTIIFVAYTVIWHFSLMFRTLALAANSIIREKQSGSWDLVVLTGVDARQIVRGKWWATVQQQLLHYVRLGLLRACAAVYLSGTNSRTFLYMVYLPYYYNSAEVSIILPEPIGILLAGIIVYILTIANLFFTAACGIPASAQMQRPFNALVWAIIARVTIPLALMTGFLCLSFYGLLRDAFSGGTSIFANIGSTIIDNGVGVIYPLVATRYEWNDYS